MLDRLMIPLLAFLATVGLGGGLIAARRARRQPLNDRLRSSGGLASMDTAGEPAARRRSWLLERLGRPFTPARPTRQLQQELARAGYHGPASVAVYIGAKMLLLFVGLAALTALIWPTHLPAISRITLILAASGGLSFAPNVWLRFRRQQRREDIRSHLPDALDLLEICVSAGMGLQMAWNAVTDDIRDVSPTLADEMALANLETHLGAPSAVAMRHMAERTEVQDVASLTAVLVQSERFGTSVAEALRVFAGSLREQRSLRAQEAAEKMAVKLIFPMVLLIFPAVLVVMAGPAVLKLIWALT